MTTKSTGAARLTCRYVSERKQEDLDLISDKVITVGTRDKQQPHRRRMQAAKGTWCTSGGTKAAVRSRHALSENRQLRVAKGCGGKQMIPNIRSTVAAPTGVVLAAKVTGAARLTYRYVSESKPRRLRLDLYKVSLSARAITSNLTAGVTTGESNLVYFRRYLGGGSESARAFRKQTATRRKRLWWQTNDT